MTMGNFVTNAGVLCGQTRACFEPVLRRSQPLDLSFFALVAVAVAMHGVVTALVLSAAPRKRCTDDEPPLVPPGAK